MRPPAGSPSQPRAPARSRADRSAGRRASRAPGLTPCPTSSRPDRPPAPIPARVLKPYRLPRSSADRRPTMCAATGSAGEGATRVPRDSSEASILALVLQPVAPGRAARAGYEEADNPRLRVPIAERPVHEPGAPAHPRTAPEEGEGGDGHAGLLSTDPRARRGARDRGDEAGHRGRLPRAEGSPHPRGGRARGRAAAGGAEGGLDRRGAPRSPAPE